MNSVSASYRKYYWGAGATNKIIYLRTIQEKNCPALLRGVSHYWYQKQTDSTSRGPAPPGLCANGHGRKCSSLMFSHSLFINHGRVWQRRAPKNADNWVKRTEGWGQIHRLWLFLSWILPVIGAGRPYLRLWRSRELFTISSAPGYLCVTTWGVVPLQLGRSGILKILVRLKKERWACRSLGTHSKITEHWVCLYCCWSPFSSVTTAPSLLQARRVTALKNKWHKQSGPHMLCLFYLLSKMLCSAKITEPFPHL